MIWCSDQKLHSPFHRGTLIFMPQSHHRHQAPFNVTPTEQSKLQDWQANLDEVISASDDDVFFLEYLKDMHQFLSGFFDKRNAKRP
jgi:hypothetical protein